ncbi:PREDICTED: MARVEL domain-containing protein 3-like [Tarenaya hassleriana]|uniref:MARVEL domain-containing protein 3-like n=1 Tax=Tarenaya hassleriana TaxID=28532 RepID=UPI00053C3FF0|nr:PREDICTED: MARVEL domain-containing protein 3-like [Tarenaya hassleriana]
MEPYRLARLEADRTPEPRVREPIARPRPNQNHNPDLPIDVESDIQPRHRPRGRVIEDNSDRDEPHRRRDLRPRERVSDEESDPEYLPRRNPHRRARPERWANLVEEEEPRPTRGQGADLKLKPPLFIGRIDPEAYLDWERRMDNIFDCYSYSDRRQVQYAAAQLAEGALAWWDRELAERQRAQIESVGTWREMKALLRKRYIPPHFHRKLVSENLARC